MIIWIQISLFQTIRRPLLIYVVIMFSWHSPTKDEKHREWKYLIFFQSHYIQLPSYKTQRRFIYFYVFYVSKVQWSWLSRHSELLITLLCSVSKCEITFLFYSSTRCSKRYSNEVCRAYIYMGKGRKSVHKAEFSQYQMLWKVFLKHVYPVIAPRNNNKQMK